MAENTPTIVVKASPKACCGCKRIIAGDPKVFAVSVTAADGEGPLETWCPACFVYEREPLEPGRWGVIAPAKCASCGTEALLHGHANACAACRSTAVVLLPRPVVIAKA